MIAPREQVRLNSLLIVGGHLGITVHFVRDHFVVAGHCVPHFVAGIAGRAATADDDQAQTETNNDRHDSCATLTHVTNPLFATEEFDASAHGKAHIRFDVSRADRLQKFRGSPPFEGETGQAFIKYLGQCVRSAWTMAVT
jgi:hypothetical protein